MSRKHSTLLATALFALPLGLAVASLPPPADVHSVYFDADADVVTPTATEIITLFAGNYDKATNRRVIVVGYGDPGEVAQYGEDGEGYCIGLAQRRAANVMSTLVGLGIKPGSITLQTFGCSHPASDGATGAVNRRVEISLGEASGW